MRGQRFDLAASCTWLSRALVAAEEPILARHGVDMWEYVVLSALDDGPAPNQSTLASKVGRDKTRLIGHLDRLEVAGLVSRTADPADRRNQTVALTEMGKSLLQACRKDIRAMEAGLLAPLTPAEQSTFVGLLDRLADVVRSDRTT